MINILIAKDEEKVRSILTELLQKEGCGMPGNMVGGEDSIRIPSKSGSFDFIGEKIAELERTLFKEKKGLLYKSVLDEVEKCLIDHILQRTEGNQLKAARILGINRNTMRSKIKKFAIDVGKWKF